MIKKNPDWPTNKPGSKGANGYSCLHEKNFNILMKESFFNSNDNYIRIKIPCPNENFEIKKVYDISNDVFTELGLKIENLKIVLIHISDKTNSSSEG